MKVITCASYHGTGSSALTDLITEYDGVKSLGDYEFPFAYSTDGLSDLEYHLVEFQDRHSSGHALKRFEIPNVIVAVMVFRITLQNDAIHIKDGVAVAIESGARERVAFVHLFPHPLIVELFKRHTSTAPKGID